MQSGRGRAPSASSSATTTARSTGTGSSSPRSAPPIKHRDWRALKKREPAYYPAWRKAYDSFGPIQKAKAVKAEAVYQARCR